MKRKAKHIMNKLSPRLKKLYDIIPVCNCFADIGTDHAYLPVYLCKNNKCKTAIASDIVKGPLDRAKTNIKKHNLNDRISVRLGGGVSTLNENEADTVLIAGMGGLIIADILRDGYEVLKSVKTIILQPMTAITDLREFLYLNNWSIDKEYLVKDNGKLYSILSVSLSDKKLEYTDKYIYIGKYLIENKPEHFNEYLDRKIIKLKKKLEGLSLSTTDTSKESIKQAKERLDAVLKIREEIK